jgi:hypothetical protein
MSVAITNDGPVTLSFDSRNKKNADLEAGEGKGED